MTINVIHRLAPADGVGFATTTRTQRDGFGVTEGTCGSGCIAQKNESFPPPPTSEIDSLTDANATYLGAPCAAKDGECDADELLDPELSKTEPPSK